MESDPLPQPASSPSSPPAPLGVAGPAERIGLAYGRWRKVLLNYLRRSSHSAQLAEDRLHDAVARCLGARTDPGTPEATGAYLRRAVINGAIDDARAQAARQHATALSLDDAAAGTADLAAQAALAALATGAGDPAEIVQHRQRLARLGEAMKELPERQRECLVRHRFDGLTQDEVASELGISRRMVVKHLGRALAYCEERVQYASRGQMAAQRQADGPGGKTSP